MKGRRALLRGPHDRGTFAMSFKTIAPFEILASPVAPGIPDVPYVQQGVFLQITNLSASSTLVSLEYVASPAFVAASGAAKLFTNIIDQSGTPQQYPTSDFLGGPVGFKALDIPAGATWLLGAQYLLLAPPAPKLTPATGATPQDNAEARGVISLEASPGTKLLVLGTIRQVFQNFDNTGKLIDITEGAYAIPLVNGPLYNF
jgi:hypothetical protein